MFKALLRKEMMELLTGFSGSRKQKRSFASQAILMAILFLIVFGSMGFFMYQIATVFAQLLISVNQTWKFFAIFALIAFGWGVLGSVSMAYGHLFRAKDNDTLLAMPIPPRMILLARMLGLYILTLFMQLMIMVPVLIVAIMQQMLSPLYIILYVVGTLLLPLLTIVITCLLAYLISLIAAQLGDKFKKALTVVLTLVFVGVYMVFYPKLISGGIGQDLDANALAMKGMEYYGFPFYALGRGLAKEPLWYLIYVLVVLAAFSLVWLIMARSFLRITTTHKGSKKAVYVERKASVRSQNKALLDREWRHFINNPMYILNCGLGLFFLIGIAVYAFIGKDTLMQIRNAIGVGSLLVFAAWAIIYFITSTVDITAPSISLEGRTIWQLQSMPIPTWNILLAKLKLQWYLCLGPVIIAVAGLSLVLQLGVWDALLLLALTLIYCALQAEMGLFFNLLMPSMDWTNETAVIKQSKSVLFTMLLSMAFAGVVALVGFLWAFYVMEPIIYLCIIGAVGLVLNILLLLWLRRRGTARFESL
ncbi:MAG: hypothetical protein IJM90_01100 [Firmicutes bacterium]|nr:hypothetical protein [Bacillota bacterium]